MKILVIGASGMIGSTVYRVLSDCDGLHCWGTVRDASTKRFFSPEMASRMIADVNLESLDPLLKVLYDLCPDVVINCAGLTKHKPFSDDPLISIPINTLMPHRLAGLCKLAGARLVHVSTDCVFSGATGAYLESDHTDASDVYGKSKALGEVFYPHTITLRTSTIGHELQSRYGLLDWFLSQESHCSGFSRAIFSGLPTVVFAMIIRDFILPNNHLSGLYHVASKPISKFCLLELIAKVYKKPIEILKDDSFVIDRSLDANRFCDATGFVAPDWEDMIRTMHSFSEVS